MVSNWAGDYGMVTIAGQTDTEETLTGGADDDVIIGGAGTNILYGKDGADTFVIGASSGSFSNDIIKDFQHGIDKIDISALGISSFSQMKPLLLQSQVPVVTGFAMMTNFVYRKFILENVNFDTLSADDFIFATSKSNVDVATDGYDTLFGTSGNDTMIAVDGKSGNDRLYGGDGDDIMDGRGSRSATLFGGDGNDTMLSAGNTLYGGDGDDTLIFGEAHGNLYGEKGADIFKAAERVFGQNNHGTGGVIEDFEVGVDKIDVSAFGVTSFDQLKLIMVTAPTRSGTYFNAYYGANKPYTTSEHAILIYNIAMKDLRAADFIFASSTTKPEAGTAFDDVIFAGDGADVLDGGDGSDKLFGGAGNDVIIGGYGKNKLYGEQGSDTFKINAATNNNIQTVHEIGDFQVGIDKIDLSATGISDFEQLKSILEYRDGQLIFKIAISLDEHSVLLNAVKAQDLTAADFIFYEGDGKSVSGTNSGDRIFGSRVADTLKGALGNDELFGGGGNDHLFGGEDNDKLFGGAGDDILHGGAGANTVYGGEGADTYVIVFAGEISDVTTIGDFQLGLDKVDLSGLGISSFDQLQLILEGNTNSASCAIRIDGLYRGINLNSVGVGDLKATDFIFENYAAKNFLGTDEGDRVFGSTKADTLSGGASDDYLYGGEGNDTLDGGNHNDRLYGGPGDDKIFGGDGNDAIYTGLGKNVVDGGEGIDTVYFLAGITLDFTNPAKSTGEAKYTTYTNIEVFHGSAVTDWMTGGTLDDAFRGDGGNDILKGMGGNDRLQGGNGDDRLDGGDGDDTLAGGAGNDTLYGGVGKDRIEGGGGDNLIIASSWDTVRSNGLGVDTVDFSKPVTMNLRNPSFNTGEAEGSMYYGIDIFDGSNGADIMVGSNYIETFLGGTGDDRLAGMLGNDTLDGGSGSDLLYGGGGADQLYGGKGADLFAYDRISDSQVAGSTCDVIFDFRASEGDRIDLSYIDANTKIVGDQGFTFLGTKTFSGKAGELRYEKKASDTYIYADVNGDKKVDFSIHLDDAMSLSKGYFFL